MKLRKYLNTILVAFLCVFGLSTFIAAPTLAVDPSYDPWSEVEKADGQNDDNEDKFSSTLTGILNGIIGASSLVAVIFILIGGINYMTSAGDAGKVAKAKSTILYAVIGLAVCVLAFAIVNWAIGAIAG